MDSAKAEESISKTGNEAEKTGGKLGSAIGTAAKWGAAIVGAAAAAGAAIYGMATSAAATTDNIDKMSQKIGISREAYQELDFITSQCGTSVDGLKNGIKTLTNQMQQAADGSSTSSKAFDRLGLTWEDGTGKLKDQETMMWEAFSALQSMEDQTEKVAIANQLFGKAGAELMPMLNGASGSIEEMRQQAHELGLVLGDETIDAGVQLTDTIDQAKRAFSGITTQIFAEFMPVIQGVLDWVLQYIPVIRQKIGEVKEFIKIALSSLAEFWQTHGETITGIVSFVFTALSEIVQIGMDLLKNIIDVIMGILSGDWETVWNGLKGILQGAFKLIDKALELALKGLVAIITGAATLFFNAGKSMFESVWDGMKNIWESLKNWVSDKVNWLTDKLTFWKKSTDEMEEEPEKPDGSHAAGLAYVPYDGYRAELHKGERVLNAEESRNYKSKKQSGNHTFIFNSPKAITAAEARRQMKKAQKELILGF